VKKKKMGGGGGGGDFFFKFIALIFTEKKICPDENPSPRLRPSINLVTLQNRPKYFFLLNFTQRSTPYVDVHVKEAFIDLQCI
jgi:hypothetical protein